MTTKRKLGTAAALLLGAALASCRARPLAPRPIPLRGASCARCGMDITDGRFAAELVSGDGSVRFYDDIGCLATDRRPNEARQLPWVMGAGGKWLPAETAFYASPGGVRTPMGYGFTAYPTAAEAQKADRQGRALRWPDVVRAARALDRSRGIR